MWRVRESRGLRRSWGSLLRILLGELCYSGESPASQTQRRPRPERPSTGTAGACECVGFRVSGA